MKKASSLLVALLFGWNVIACHSSSNAFSSGPALTQAVTTITPSYGVTPPVDAPTSWNPYSIGYGWADVIPHQIIRTANDQLYLFALKGDSYSTLLIYWTNITGLPNGANDFVAGPQIAYSSAIISVSPIYDGGHIIHVLTNERDGKVIDRPFDTSTNQYGVAKTLSTDGGSVNGSYVGTGGVTGMIDQHSVIHVVYWSSSNYIVYSSYSYDDAHDTLASISSAIRVDVDGKANHLVLAISPLDDSVTVAWVSQATTPSKILARTETSGSWGTVQVVSSAAVWTSTNDGINIDQGPSLVIGQNGVKYLAYIEDWQVTVPYDYGRVHLATYSGSAWTDQYIGSYSHDPAVAIDSANQIYILGHGYPLNSACTGKEDLCLFTRNNDGSWAAPRIILAHYGLESFDSSPSVKWSAIGFNRPETVEFIFSEVSSGYTSPVLYYGRIGSDPNLGISFFLPLVLH